MDGGVDACTYCTPLPRLLTPSLSYATLTPTPRASFVSRTVGDRALLPRRCKGDMHFACPWPPPRHTMAIVAFFRCHAPLPQPYEGLMGRFEYRGMCPLCHWTCPSSIRFHSAGLAFLRLHFLFSSFSVGQILSLMGFRYDLAICLVAPSRSRTDVRDT